MDVREETRLDAGIASALARWRAAGIIDDDTAAAIRAHEDARDAGGAGGVGLGTPPPPPAAPDEGGVLPRGRAGLVAEGLAYVGATLAFGAGAALFGQMWDSFGSVARVLVALSATLALGGAAAALGGSGSDALRRLRSLLSALAVGGVAATVAVSLVEFTGMEGDLVALLAGAAALAAAVPVHLLRPSWPTTLALGGSLLTTVTAGESVLGMADNEVTIGVTLAGIGLAWAALGWAGWLRPRTAFEVTGLLVGGVGVEMLTVQAFPLAGPIIGLVVAGAVLAVALVEERTPPAVLAGLGITVFAPQLVFELFGETIGGPLALFVGGLALVTFSVLVIRQRSAS